MEDDIERFEEERELELYREYRDVLPMFTYVIETERRFYLANKVDLEQLEGGWVKVELIDAWVWDMFRPARFVSTVRVMTQRDVNVEELRRDDAASLLDAPGGLTEPGSVSVLAAIVRAWMHGRERGAPAKPRPKRSTFGVGSGSLRATGAAASGSWISSCSVAVCS
jgi:hypothetical protein